MVNVGVIGVGYLGQHHARIFSEIEGARLVGVVDADLERAKEIAAKYGCEAFAEINDIIDKTDALSIATPTIAHYEAAATCISKGKHLLIEKPLTATLEEADRLIEAADKAGLIVQVGLLERFNPVVVKAFDLSSHLTYIETERLSPFLGRSLDIDITLDLMIHDVDILLALKKRDGAKVKEIRGSGAMMLTENIDFAKAWLEFDDGCCASLTASRISEAKSRRMLMLQKGACLSLDYQAMAIKRFTRKDGVYGAEEIFVEKKEPLKEELQDFIRCIVQKKRPLVSALDGREALELVLRISQMIKNNRQGA
ncbi:MAG: Gfo/Idh/MocA family oxidoreductase [Nitrospirae bacterium]|nr:Gfo/Idh/MocA family oxidoreductase [Nitrospirota bacterium]